MHPAADADPQQLHARARAGGGTKGPDACISRDAMVDHKLDAREIPTPCRTSRNT